MAGIEDDSMQAISIPSFTPINRKSPSPPGQCDNMADTDFESAFLRQTISRTSSLSALTESVAEVGLPTNVADEIYGSRLENNFTRAIEDDSDVLVAFTEPLTKGDPTYSYEKIIEEAEGIYHDKKPPFCIINKNVPRTKTVMAAENGEEVDMVYRTWQDKSYGY